MSIRLTTMLATTAALLIMNTVAQGEQPVVDYPFDLVEDQGYDSNGFPINPRWRIQDSPGCLPDPTLLCGAFPPGSPQGNPQCTQDQVTIDSPSGLRKLICGLQGGDNLKGHINWGPATFTGPVTWTKIALDGDYNWDMATSDNRILTTHRPTLHTEARGKETVKGFKSPWWREFRRMLHEEKATLIRNRTAVISGLLNLDNVHGAYSELHPIYILAILADRQYDEDQDLYVDTWAMFLRNWGDQGFCSRHQHYLQGLPSAPCGGDDTDEECVWIAVDLPVEPAEEFFVGNREFRARGWARGPVIERSTDTVTVRFILSDIDPEQPPRRKNRPIVNGEIELLWRPAPGHTPELGVRSVFSPDEQPSVGGTETLLEFLEEQASPEFRENLLQMTTAVTDEVEDTILIKESASEEIPLEADRDEIHRPFVLPVESPRNPRTEIAEFTAICDGARHLLGRDDMLAQSKAVGINPAALTRFVNECLDVGYIDKSGAEPVPD